ncbi:MAG: lactate utilization protein [Anaerolineae bacterium]|nr:lactate utilization protein [Anaerolineae bacterium]
MTTARDDILTKLRARVRGPQERPPVWESNRPFDDLAAQFVQELNTIKGEAFHVESLGAALEKLGALLAELDAKQIAANDETPLNDLDLAGRWPDRVWFITDKTEGDLRAFCAAADVGITGVDAALAETGSLVVTSGPGKSRMVSLLPPVHIALVPVSRLTNDIFTYMAAQGHQTPDTMPANRVIITGPSKSGDIEQILALGMHGPKRCIAILYDD